MECNYWFCTQYSMYPIHTAIRTYKAKAISSIEQNPPSTQTETQPWKQSHVFTYYGQHADDIPIWGTASDGLNPKKEGRWGFRAGLGCSGRVGRLALGLIGK